MTAGRSWVTNVILLLILSWVVEVVVSAANVSEKAGAKLLLKISQFPLTEDFQTGVTTAKISWPG